MDKFGEKLGQLDDESVVYRADDPKQQVNWGRAIPAYIAGGLVAAGLLAARRALVLSEGAAILAVLAASVAFLVVYVVWRRRRNRRLTGSPTSWPQ